MNKQIQGLLGQANPQLARLLDEQERQKAQQARMQGANYGNDAMGRFLSAASGAARSATEGGRTLANNVMGNERGMGAYEQAAVQKQNAKAAQLQQLQGKSPEQLRVIQRNALAAGQTELADAAKAMVDSYDTGGEGVKYKGVKNVMVGGKIVPARFNNNTGRYENLNTGEVLDVSSIEVDDGEGGVPVLDAPVIKMINEVQTESQQNFLKANKLSSLIDRVLKEDDFTSGAMGALEQTIKSFFGKGDDETLTKKDFAGFAQIEALKLLPPGSASNMEFSKSIETVPDANSSKEVILSYLQSNLKAATMLADFNRFQAKYMVENNGLSVGAITEWQKSLSQDKKDYYGIEKPSKPSNKPSKPAIQIDGVDISSQSLLQEIERRRGGSNPFSPLMGNIPNG
jgi:hypothetical protein